MDELERWMNPDRSLPPLPASPPQWDTHNVDNPGVLHLCRQITGKPRSADGQFELTEFSDLGVGDVITALRLVTNSPVSILFQEQRTEGLLAWGGGGTSWGWGHPQPSFVTTTLDNDRAVEVKKVWGLLRTSPNMGLLTLPLRRWESSLLRRNLEDRLIDAWISLEALLMGKNEGELSFHAAVRLAEFLSNTGAERRAVFSSSRASYKWRSAIVHGSNPGKAFETRHPL